LETLREIEELVEFDGRGPGTDAERRAGAHLAERLRSLGREVEVEPIAVYPNYALTHAIHGAIAVVGSVLSVSVPVAGMALVLFAAVSTFTDLGTDLQIVRRLTGRRASQNVVSPERSDKPGALILMAHYDAARTGLAFNRRSMERAATFGKLIRRPVGPFEPFFWSMLVILSCTALRLIGIEGLILTVVQFVPTVVLILSVALLLDIALSGIVPGASDNASGVATVLQLAERYGGKLEHFDLWVLLPGAEEGLLLGSRAWLRQHRRELHPERTVFLNIDTVGNGTVRFATKAGFVFAYPFHPSILELCREIAEEENGYGARGYVDRIASDGHAARIAGFPAVTIRCLNALDYAPNYHSPRDTPDRIEPEALERALGFCSELVQRLDERIGDDLARSGEGRETALAEGEG
jgi:Peptidase family M28